MAAIVSPYARPFVTDDDDSLIATTGACMLERVNDERNTGDRHQRLRDVAARGGQTRAAACGKDDRLRDPHVLHSRHLNTCARSYIRVTFGSSSSLRTNRRAMQMRRVLTRMANSNADRYERDTIEILKRLSRRPIEPAPDNELMADLGFDSLQVLELVGELEDHFNIAVPLNSLTHIRTVRQIVAEVRTLASAESGTPS
jgi:acyl carrier protein